MIIGRALLCTRRVILPGIDFVAGLYSEVGAAQAVSCAKFESVLKFLESLHSGSRSAMEHALPPAWFHA